MRFAIAAVAMAPWLRRPAGEPAARRAQPSPALPRVVLRQLPVLDLHAVRHPPEHRARRRRDHGGAAGGGRAALVVAARRSGSACASPRASPARSPASPWSRSRATRKASWRAARSLGIALLVGAVTCEALYVVIGKKLSASIGPKRISALINLWGLALVAPFALWQLRGFSPSFIPESSWWLLLASTRSPPASSPCGSG